jgi:HD-like signal output (HDOD) protein
MPLAHTTIQTRILTAGAVTFPRTVSRLEHLIVDGEAKAEVVAEVVAADPVLTALVLGQANAGASKPVLQLTVALRQAGMGPILTCARAVQPVHETSRQALAGCWAQANAASVLLPILYDLRGWRLKKTWEREYLHIVGLLHDLGHALAMVQFPHEYARACLRLRDAEGLFPDLLAQEVGASAEELVVMAGEAWKLPATLVEALTGWRHPAAATAQPELAHLVHVAHVLVQAAGFLAGGDRFVAPLDPASISALDLRTSDCETALKRLDDEMAELELFEGALA